jgi:hypothetical protein
MMFWPFKLSFVVDILAFSAWRLFGLLFKNWANFIFTNLPVTLVIAILAQRDRSIAKNKKNQVS